MSYNYNINIKLYTLGDIAIVFIVENAIIMGLLFWCLNYLGSFFYKVKVQQLKYQFYECGFKSMSDLNFSINVNFLLIALFLILYDIEFLLLFPALFNILTITIYDFLILILFLFGIFICLLYDWQYNALQWQF